MVFMRTQWCSEAVHTHSLAFMCTKWVFRGCSQSLKGFHVHSIAFRGYSILIQRCSCALNCIKVLFNSYTNVFFLMVTPWWVAFNNNSMAFTHTQWVITLTQWHSCALNGCSRAVPTRSLAFMCTQWVFRSYSQSLKGIYGHSLVFRGCWIPAQQRYIKAQWICFQLCKAC